MLNLPRRTSVALVGWLWADILLGLFVLFLAANSAGAPVSAAEGIDPRPIEIAITVDGRALLGGVGAAVDREQQRIAAEAERRIAAEAGPRRVAIVLAWARHGSPADGDRMAALATEGLTEGRFAGSVIRGYHELAPGDDGTLLTLEVYLYH